MRLFSTAARREDDIANDFAQLVEEGRALLGEMVGKPVKTTRDTLDQVSEKVADLQDYALRAARRGMVRGAKYGKQAAKYGKRADMYVRENPWPVLAGGVALGVLAALLWSSQRR